MTKWPLEYVKDVYDPVHGYIPLTETEVNVIDTDVFQRLHQIRQLGLAYLVYPGATHTRFSHSLGAMYVMGKICDRFYQRGLINDPDDICKLRLAALLHDVGHYPFSHVIENLMRDLDPPVKHEELSVMIIEKTEIKDKLGSYNSRDIASLINKESKQAIYSLLISSDVDADRLDYLQRDSYHTGVAYGSIDADRIIRMLTVDANSHLGVREGGTQALENMLIARYHMYQTVYQHKVVVGFETVLRKIYRQLMEEGLIYDPESVKRIVDAEEFQGYTDSQLISKIGQRRKTGKYGDHLSELIDMLFRRNPLSLAGDVRGASFTSGGTTEYGRFTMLAKQNQIELLSNSANVPKEWLFFVQSEPLTFVDSASPQTALYVIGKDNSSEPAIERPGSILQHIYRTNFLSARLYTKAENCNDVKDALVREGFMDRK